MHRLERVLDGSSDEKNVVARASYITCEKLRSGIVHLSHSCLSSVNKEYICGNRMGDASLG